MRRLFQNFGESDYDRPNRKWLCGLGEEGCACPLGPTASGKCPERAECQPKQQDDRWHCNRSTLRGGSCEESDGGPTPDGVCCRVNRCQPLRSVRSIRSRIGIGAALFLLGLLLFLWGSPVQNEVLAPGALTSHHAQLLTGPAWSNRCASCHPDGNNTATVTPVSLEQAADASAEQLPTTQSALCLDCHDKTMERSHALMAHGLPPEQLMRTGSNNRAGMGDGSLLDTLSTALLGDACRELACATCHQEHHGADHNLLAISDGRCQACHAEQFDHFAGNHPDFDNWPFRRRTRIAFNHVSHEGKHFVSKGKSFDCARCHQDDATRDHKVMASYEQSCAECHDDDIKRSTAEGWPLIALPMIDTEALADAGHTIDWPAAASGDFDGMLPIPTKLVLAADPNALQAMRELGVDFDFFDVDPDDPNDLAAAAQLTKSLKELLLRLRQEGQQAIAKGQPERANPERANPERANLVAGFPTAVAEEAYGRWIAQQTNPGDTKTRFDKVSQHPSGGWFVDDATLSIRYAPQGHADPVLKAWIDLAASLEDQPELQKAALAELAGPTSAGQCVLCHSIEHTGSNLSGTEPSGSLIVNWHALDPSDQPRGFTKFSHRPHTTQSQLADCTHCHSFDRTLSQVDAYLSHSPQDFTSHFLPVTKSTCTECHQPHAATSNCTQCHNYHVDHAQ